MAAALSGAEKYPNPFEPRHFGITIYPNSLRHAFVPSNVREATRERWVMFACGNQSLGAMK